MFKKLIILGLLGYGGWYGYENYVLPTTEDPTAIKNYLPNIIKVTGDQVLHLIESGEHNRRPTLLYIYESDSLLSKWNFSDINHFAKQFTRSQLNIILLSLDNDEYSLAKYLINAKPLVRPLLLQTGEREVLFSKMRVIGSDYDGTIPHIAVIDKSGHVSDIPFGFDPKKKINGLVLRSIDSKL